MQSHLQLSESLYPDSTSGRFYGCKVDYSILELTVVAFLLLGTPSVNHIKGQE